MFEQPTQTTDFNTSTLAYDLVSSPSTEIGARLPTDREKQLFLPIEDVAPSDPVDDNYDDLLNPDIEPAMSVEAAAVRPKPRQATRESEDEARQTIELASSQDAVFGHLLDDYVRTKGIEVGNLPRMLRADPDLRLSVGTHLIDKISRLSSELPRRIRVNTQKGPGEGGYGDLGYISSQEYAALLALSMLDGSFSKRREGSDPVTYDPTIDEGLGQHRYAARKILHSS